MLTESEKALLKFYKLPKYQWDEQITDKEFYICKDAGWIFREPDTYDDSFRLSPSGIEMGQLVREKELAFEK